MKLRVLLQIVIVSFVLLSCGNNDRHPVPYFQFDLNINLNLPTYQSLTGVGGWAYINDGGSRGIVVYRRSLNEFVAFDRHSPTDPEGTCESGLETDEDNFLILNDPCSDAQFSLYDGSIIGGDTDWGLRMYMTVYNGGEILRIYNP